MIAIMKARSGKRRRGRRHEILILGGLVVLLLVINVILPEPEPREVEGRARVIDGDSLIVDGVEIRLKGIDAPEVDQTCEREGSPWSCGKEAVRRLRFFVRAAVVTCSGRSYDKHGRLLAVCKIGDRNVNRWLVDEGWAVSFGDYQAAESKARRERRGVWSGPFKRPADWRAERRDG